MPRPTKIGEMGGNLPGKPGPAPAGRQRLQLGAPAPGGCGVGSAALWPDLSARERLGAAGTSPWPVPGCSLFAGPGTSRILTSGTPPSRAHGVVLGAWRFFGAWDGLGFDWVLFCLSVSLSGFFVAVVLFMFPFWFGVGGVVSFLRLVFYFAFPPHCKSPSSQVSLAG